jgi:hypothetical protein
MYPGLSNNWSTEATIGDGSRTVITKIYVAPSNTPCSPTSNSGALATLVPVTGYTKIDRTASTWGVCEFTYEPDGTTNTTPTGLTHPVSPNGNELWVWQGFVYPNGSSEYAQLGVFPIETVTINYGQTGNNVLVDASDRSSTMSRLKSVTSITLAAGTTVVAAIQALITSRIPWATFAVASGVGAFTIPAVLSYPQNTDLWSSSQTIAGGAGLEVFCRYDGVFVIQPIPNWAMLTPVFAVSATTNPNLLRGQRVLTRVGVANDILTNGEGTSLAVPVGGRAQNTNPTSPTSITGGWGDVPNVITSSLYTSDAQANAGAQAELFEELGQVDTHNPMEIIPNPALQAEDVITGQSSLAGLAAAVNYVIDVVQTPFEPGNQQVTLRRAIPE